MVHLIVNWLKQKAFDEKSNLTSATEVQLQNSLTLNTNHFN